MKRLVRDLMRHRDLRDFPCVEADATVSCALKVLKDYNSGSLLVLNDDSLVGVFSERDFARMALEESAGSWLNSRVATFMQNRVIYVTDEYTLEECLAVMASMHVRHLPVLKNDVPIALLSMRHIMEALIEDREFMIGQLVRYVTGGDFEEFKVEPKVLVREPMFARQKALAH